MNPISYLLVGVILGIGISGMIIFIDVYTRGYKDNKGEWLVMPHRGPNPPR
jgi:hypothetical protein